MVQNLSKNDELIVMKRGKALSSWAKVVLPKSACDYYLQIKSLRQRLTQQRSQQVQCRLYCAKSKVN